MRSRTPLDGLVSRAQRTIALLAAAVSRNATVAAAFDLRRPVDAGRLAGLITQNVDGLHQAGGAREVIELHGGLDRVICLECGAVTSRADLDQALA